MVQLLHFARRTVRAGLCSIVKSISRMPKGLECGGESDWKGVDTSSRHRRAVAFVK